MMTLDESTALAELNDKPSEWVIWHNLPPRDMLAIWPNSNRDTLHFQRIEGAYWPAGQYRNIPLTSLGLRMNVHPGYIKPVPYEFNGFGGGEVIKSCASRRCMRGFQNRPINLARGGLMRL